VAGGADATSVGAETPRASVRRRTLKLLDQKGQKLFSAPQFPVSRTSRTRKGDRSQEKQMKFRPLHDRVVVHRIDPDAKSAGGIIIPDTAQEKPSQGEIIAVGSGGRDESGKLIPIDLKVGDRVLFGKWSGTEVKLDNVDYLIMRESDIMGVLDDVTVSPAKRKAA
jgi:chaperonin GroES